MGRSFLARIKLDVLRARLSAADGASYTRADVRRWLLDAGFEPAGDWWRVKEADLLLDPAEVAEAVPQTRERGWARVA